MSENILDGINCPKDIKKLKIEQLPQLAQEIRQLIVQAVEKNGGHLASSLGAVDAIIALYYVYDVPNDKIIFDVGHQSYCAKILSGRKQDIMDMRSESGISGFPDIFESDCDSFCAGHAGTSLSAGFGYAYSRDKQNLQYNVIDFVGDASFFNGQNLEALFSNGEKPKNYLIVFNDNGMSISKNSNGLYKFFNKLTYKKSYIKTKNFIKKIMGERPFGRFLKMIKSSFKRSLTPNSALEGVGLKYCGVYNGNDVISLVRIMQKIKNSQTPTFLHIKTKKGLGYQPAESQAEQFHGVGKKMQFSNNSFSNSVSDIMEKIVEKDSKVVAITAGMTMGTGLTQFGEKYPKNIIDVGICEQYALSLSAGMALSGLKPVVFIYSTFLQRAYDQIITDVAMQNLPIVMCIDRAGVVGSDGQTHQGVFDLSYLRHIPNLSIFTPATTWEFENMLNYALTLQKPIAIRYPNGVNQLDIERCIFDNDNLWQTIKQGEKGYILAVGPRMVSLALESSKALQGSVGVINVRSVKPLDFDTLNRVKNYPLITLEENVISGGFGESVLSYYANNGENVKIKTLGIKDNFIKHASVESQLQKNDLNVENIVKFLGD